MPCQGPFSSLLPWFSAGGEAGASKVAGASSHPGEGEHRGAQCQGESRLPPPGDFSACLEGSSDLCGRAVMINATWGGFLFSSLCGTSWTVSRDARRAAGASCLWLSALSCSIGQSIPADRFCPATCQSPPGSGAGAEGAETLSVLLPQINVLLQAFISQLKLEGFALMADMVYVTQVSEETCLEPLFPCRCVQSSRVSVSDNYLHLQNSV